MNSIRFARHATAPLFAALLTATAAAAFAQAPPPGYGPQPYGPQPMFAGPKDRPHFYWGGQLGGFFIAKQVTDQAGYMGQGGGGGLHAGFRFSKMLAVELNLGITYHNETLGAFGGGTVIALDNLFLMSTTVDVKIYLSTTGLLQPYLQAGVGYGYLGATYNEGYCASFNCDTTFAQGPLFQIGGGFDYWLTPRLTLGSRLLYRGIRFSEANYGDVTVRTNSSNFINGLALDFTIALHY
jgi:opacity protein-like surface antigen